MYHQKCFFFPFFDQQQATHQGLLGEGAILFFCQFSAKLPDNSVELFGFATAVLAAIHRSIRQTFVFGSRCIANSACFSKNRRHDDTTTESGRQ